MIDVDLDKLPASNIQTTRPSFASATVSFSLPYNSRSPYQKLTECRVWLHGEIVLIGPVTECEESRDADGERVWNIEISDRWYWLETCSYVTELTRYGKPSSKAYVPMCVPGGRYVMVDPGVYKPKEDKSDTTLTPTIAIGAAITDIIDNSKHLNCKLKLDFDHEQEMIPFEASLSYLADLMRAVQQWRPGLTTFFDYADPDKPVLVITDKGDVITLDAKRDNLTTIALKPRPDLIPPAVGVLGLATTGSQNISYTMAVYPPDSESKFKDPGALLLSVSLPSGTQTSESAPSRGALTNELINMTPEEAAELLGIPVVKSADVQNDVLPKVSNMLTYNAARAILRGEKFPETLEEWANWWKKKAPQLFENCEIQARKQPVKKPTTPDAIYSNHVTTDLPYEWTSGQYNGVGKGVKWTALRIDQEIYIKNPPDRLKGRFPTHVGGGVYMGKFSCYVHAVGRKYQAYALDEDGTELPGEGIPEPDPEPEEDPGSGGDPRPEPTIDEAIPQYDQVVEAVWKASQKLEFEGTISVIGKVMSVRPGDKINIVNDRPEYAGMETTVQSVTVDEYAGTMTLSVGPASHLSLQTAAERARIMSDNANKALSKTDELTTSLNLKVVSEGETEAPGPTETPGTGGSSIINYPPRQRPQAAEVGPCFRMIEASAGKVDIVAEFSVRGVWSDDGETLKSVQWYGGNVYGPKDSLSVGKQGEWNDLAITSGNIYCNITIDKEGKVTSAKVENSEGTAYEGKIWSVGKKGKSGDDYTPSGSGWDGEDATVSILIASVAKDNIVHHHLGSISVPVMPKYVLFECKDYVEEDSPASDDVSLIADKNDRYTLLKRLMPGKEVKFGGISEADPPKGFLKINAREVKMEDVPQEKGSTITPGTSLIDKDKVNEKDDVNWERTFYFRSIKAMEHEDYERYDGGEPNGTRCRVVIDLRDGVLLIGAYSGTMTDPP